MPAGGTLLPVSTPTRPPLAGSAITLTGSGPTQVRDDGVWFVACGHDAADALARDIRAQHGETGWWPLLTQELDVEEIWDAALDADVPIGASAVQDVFDGDVEEMLAEYAGDMDLPAKVTPRMGVSGALDTVGDVEWMGVLLVPCRQPWQSLPFIGFGAFHDCPDPTDQGAVARWLYDEHGSDPIAVGADSVVFRSLRPVAPPSLAATVRNLLSYCPTLLESDMDVHELAGLLQAGVTRLGLWWD
jgi:hypothetical protein